MKMSEFIAAVGDDNVQFQPLDGCLIRADSSKGKTRITFGTTQPVLHDTRDYGIVLWIPRDRVKAVLDGQS